MRLKNKKAIVTGGAHGIGKAIAKNYAREGAKVCILDIDDTASAEVVEDIEKKVEQHTPHIAMLGILHK